MNRLFFVLLVVSSFVSCSRGIDSVECESKNTDKGIIESSIDFGSCIFDIPLKKIVVQDTSGYIELQKEISNGIIQSDSCTFPGIDFGKYTLLGQYASASGCVVNFNRNVAVDSSKTEVNYIIAPEGCGDCESVKYSYNFVLVDKIDDSYTILFNGEAK